MSLFDRINPVRHASTRESAEHYRTEPYVVAADIAGVAPHLGRGGWTWYTGAAAWTLRLAVEEILGVRLIQNELQIRPSLPRDWDRAEMTFRRGAATIAVTLQVDHDLDQEARIFVDGADRSEEHTSELRH